MGIQEKLRNRGVKIFLLTRLTKMFGIEIFVTYANGDTLLLINREQHTTTPEALQELAETIGDCFSYTKKKNGSVAFKSMVPPKASWNIGEFVSYLKE